LAQGTLGASTGYAGFVACKLLRRLTDHFAGKP
jgi:hypothetical protein